MLACVLALGAALIPSGCGDDDDSGSSEADATAVPGAAEAAELQGEIENFSDEQQIKRVGTAWAEPFAAGDEAMCGYMHPDVVPAAESCPQFAEGALTGGLSLQGSYAGAKVTDVTVSGDTAKATFSNGEPVEFAKDDEGAWKIASVRREGAEAP